MKTRKTQENKGAMRPFISKRKSASGSALLVVMGVLFVIFIMGFGYANYLSGQVYALEREKDYEAAQLILKSAFTEALYLLNYSNTQFVMKLKGVGPKDVTRQYEFFEAKIETSKKMLEKVFEKYKSREIRVVFELAEIIPCKEYETTNEKFAKFIVKGYFKAGMLATRLEAEVVARLSAVTFTVGSGNAAVVKINPDRIYAVTNQPRALERGKYFGICLFNGSDVRAARESAEKNSDFRAVLVNSAGSVITNRANVTDGFVLTFGPLMLK